MHLNYPVLYSFRRCPYAIRARLALGVSAQQVVLREVKLSQKPAELALVSPKATVPVLVLPEGQVLEESLDIMVWALQRNDPARWLDESLECLTMQLITEHDTLFKPRLDYYKYAERYPEHSRAYYRSEAEVFLHKLEQMLNNRSCLLAERVTLLDIALLPFIRQFAGVEPLWFSQSEYVLLRKWMNNLLESVLFKSVMQKYTVWQAGEKEVIFPRLAV